MIGHPATLDRTRHRHTACHTFRIYLDHRRRPPGPSRRRRTTRSSYRTPTATRPTPTRGATFSTRSFFGNFETVSPLSRLASARRTLLHSGKHALLFRARAFRHRARGSAIPQPQNTKTQTQAQTQTQLPTTRENPEVKHTQNATERDAGAPRDLRGRDRDECDGWLGLREGRGRHVRH